MKKPAVVTFDPFRDGELFISVPTTESQKEIWSSIEIDSDANLCYNESIRISLKGDLDPPVLEKAINSVIQKHDALRGTFSPRGKEFLVSQYEKRALPITDLSNSHDQNQKIQEKILNATKHRFDLVHGPLFIYELVKIQSNEHILFITAHHLICDGWSIAVIVNEISVAYEKLIIGETLSDDLPKQLYDYALETKDVSVDPYWLKEFVTIPKPLDLPADLPRPEFRRYESHRIDYQINPEVIKKAQGIAAKNRKSFYQYLLTAFDVLLYKLTKNDDFVVGISSAAQSAAGLNNLVGHLVNLLPIRTKIQKDMSYKDLLDQTKTKMLDAFDHQNSTFGQILNSLKIERDPSRIPLVNIIFNVDQQYPGQGLEFKNIQASYESNPRHYENFEIFINATTLRDKCVLECQYNIHLFKPDTIQNWLKNLETILMYFNENVDKSLESFVSKDLIIPNKQVEKVKVEQLATNASSKNIAITKELWEAALGVNGIPDSSNFFSIGGHSLMGVDICHKVQEKLGVKLTLKDLIKNPKLNQFAALLPDENTEKASTNIVKPGMGSDRNESSLTMNQMQTWYLEQMNPGTSMHNLPSAIRIKKHVDSEKLKQAYLSIIENHPALRTSFQKGPIQKIESMEYVRNNFLFEYEKLNEELIIKEMNKKGTNSFDLTCAPLVQVKLYEINNNEFILFTMFHHIIFDGWCFDIFFQELTDTYEGKKITKEEISYFDYAAWQEQYIDSSDYQNDLKFWQTKLSGNLPVLDIPIDYPRPPLINHEGGTFPFSIDSDLADRLRRYCEKSKISLFSLFLGTFKKTLMDYAQSDEVIVGIPVRGRNSNGLLNTIGYFVNVTPVKSKRVNNILDYLVSVQDEVGDSLAYQDVPFEKVMQALKIKRDPSRTGIFQSFFSYQDVDNRVGMFDGLQYSQVNVEKASTHTDIDMWIKASRKKIEGAIEYRLDLFKEKTIDRLKEYFLDLLEYITTTDECTWNHFISPSVTDEISVINKTYTDNLPTKTIVEYVDEFAKNTSNAIALVAGNKSYTYEELKHKSNGVAASLIAAGVESCDLVGLSVDRDENMLINLLGIMKAGAGYVPLDPYFPSDRLDYMIEHSRLRHLICNKEYKDRFSHHDVKMLEVESLDYNKTLNDNIPIEQEQTIYVIYTSGSTGKPKGVNLSYRSVLNFLESMKKKPGMTSESKLLAVTTLSFDIAVLELYVPLISGGTVVVASKEDTIDGEALKSLIGKNNINIMQATPSTWRLLLSAGWIGAQNFKILCGGEPFPKDLAHTLIPMVSEVWNMYGPTETTVWSTIKKLDDSPGSILIGSPIDNTSVYVLDENKGLVPFGAVGELYIGGDGLALGYIHREDLTSEKFMKDTIRSKGLMYQTGDLARFHANGELECLGRNDGQVKVRGYRIELGEIESILHEHENTDQAVVMVREDRPGDVRLVGYLKLKNKSTFDQFALREFLNNKLPIYMLPSNYILMDSFPQTLNGKIDKKNLPALDLGESNDSIHIKESLIETNIDDIEREFASIWLAVLGVRDYRKEDNFFEVGGHSLLSVELFGKLSKAFDIELSLASMITHNTFEQILNLIKKECGEEVQIKKETSVSSQFTIPGLCSSLVAIKPQGDKIPVFCFHGVGGNVLNYMRLGPACGDHPLIGVQSQGVDGKSIPLKSIEEMVNKYVDEIRLVQPQGPYILSGASMGGLIALEAARKLKEQGQTIKSIILLDTFGPDIDIKQYSSKENFFAAKWQALKWRIKKITVRLKSSILTIFGMPIPHEIRYFNIEVLNYQALWSHKVKEYEGDIEIIRAPITDVGWYSDPQMGWRKAIKGDVKTYIIDGDHEGFVESKDLPKAFSDVLNRL